MDIRVLEIEGGRGAAALHVGPFQELGPTFAAVGEWAQAHPDVLAGQPRVLYPDDPQTTPPEQLRSYVAIPVTAAATFEDGGQVTEMALPGGRYVVGVHRGPYEGLATAWPELMAAVTARELEPDWSRLSFEVYGDDPSTTPAEELVTELYLPVT